MESLFNEKLGGLLEGKNANNVFITNERYGNLVEKIKGLKSFKEKKKPADYAILRKYDVISVGGLDKLISPVAENSTVVKYYASIEDVYSIIHDAHVRIGHGGRNRMKKELGIKYNNITTECIMIYLNLCRHCQEKASKKRKGLVVKPMVFNDMNCRGQVDLIDMQTQSVNDYKWILNYQVFSFFII